MGFRFLVNPHDDWAGGWNVTDVLLRARGGPLGFLMRSGKVRLGVAGKAPHPVVPIARGGYSSRESVLNEFAASGGLLEGKMDFR